MLISDVGSGVAAGGGPAMVRGTVVSRLKASRRPGLWVAVARAGRVARTLSRRRTRWSYRVGYALERAGQYDQAWEAYAAAAGPGGLPARPDPLDPVAVETARLLAVRQVRAEPSGRLFGDLGQRRGRIIPVVPRAQRRRWQQAPADDHAATLHLLYARHREHYLPRYFARAERYTMPGNRVARAWRWYVGDVAIQSWKLLRRNGRYVRRTVGVPVVRQLREMVWLSLRLPSMPENYYKYELYRPEHRAAADGYLHGHENSPVLYEALAETTGLLEAAPLTDKVAFAARAVEHGLAVVPTLAVLRDGEVAEQGELPPADLFVKPLSGKGGRGVGKWRYVAETDSFRDEGEAVPRARLLRVLADRSVGESHLVQPCLANHPELADLALGAVVTCRLITITNEAGRPEPVIATFRMPAVADAIVDNMHRGGIAAPVEIETGVLGAASDYAIAGPAVRHPRHPASGGAIEGRKLPLWDEAVALAITAHERFHPRLLVGWDISFGADGPILLEGNERPGVGGLQRLHNAALGRHRFGELIAHHLTQRLGDPRGPAR